ncbi:MAG: hypothetical protein RLZZ507_1943 [Cyanobacteriota bacterium]
MMSTTWGKFFLFSFQAAEIYNFFSAKLLQKSNPAISGSCVYNPIRSCANFCLALASIALAKNLLLDCLRG